MRVLHVIPSLQKGGAERLTLDICAELNKRDGIHVRLLTLHNDNLYGDAVKLLDWQVAPSYVIPSITSKTKVDVSAFVKEVEDFRPDVIHSHLFEAEMVSRYQLFKGVRYFTHCHDNMVQLEKFSFGSLFDKTRLTNLYERNIILKQYEACNNHFIAISKDTFSFFTKVLPASLKKKVHLQHNAINFKKFNIFNHLRTTSDMRMVNIGSFVPKKNQVFLVEVMKILRKKNINAYLTFLGDGPELQKVKKQAKKYDLNDRITFAGNVENVEDYLKTANLYVHSAYYEPFGLVLLEAMAAGLPVITLDGKGNRDLVKDCINGFFIQESNPGLFADKSAGLMQNETLYREMSANAVEFSKGFDITNYVDQLLELYKTAD